MKRWLLVAILLVVGCGLNTEAAAQPVGHGGLRLSFGPALAGMDLANSYPGIAKSQRLGMTGGLAYELGLGDLSIDFGIQYRTGGVILKNTLAYDKIILFIDKLALPLNLRFYFGSNAAPYIRFGGEMAYLLSPGYQTEKGSVVVKADQKEGDYKSWIFGLSFGAGYEMVLSEKMKLFIEAGYVLGLSNIIEKNAATQTYKAREFTICVGIKL